MATYKTCLSQRAAQDLLNIVIYITNELKAPEVALNLSKKIDEAIGSLETMPERIGFVKDERLATKGIRKLMIERYFIFFTINDPEKTVNIVTVQYARRDWKNLI